MRRFARAAAVGWLVVLPGVSALGCAHEVALDPHAPTEVTLVNDMGTWYDLYLVQGVQRVQVGRIDSKSTLTLKVPSDLSYSGSKVTLLAIPALGQRYSFFHRFIANPGTHVRMRLPR
ncbi:MAG TPA: hypothetical protein VFW04_10730 [Gemmatimonadaceae bacterium]|nr:hypothetical protein [Gemmatimonadaceae bacterium]